MPDHTSAEGRRPSLPIQGILDRAMSSGNLETVRRDFAPELDDARHIQTRWQRQRRLLLAAWICVAVAVAVGFLITPGPINWWWGLAGLVLLVVGTAVLSAVELPVRWYWSFSVLVLVGAAVISAAVTRFYGVIERAAPAFDMLEETARAADPPNESEIQLANVLRHVDPRLLVGIPLGVAVLCLIFALAYRLRASSELERHDLRTREALRAVALCAANNPRAESLIEVATAYRSVVEDRTHVTDLREIKALLSELVSQGKDGDSARQTLAASKTPRIVINPKTHRVRSPLEAGE